MFGLTSTLCVQLLNNTAGCLTSELKLAWLCRAGLILRLGTNGENSNELWVCMKSREFLAVLRNCSLLKNSMQAISYLIRLKQKTRRCANS